MAVTASPIYTGIDKEFIYARFGSDGTGPTTIPTGTGYATKLVYQRIEKDMLGICDLANNRFIIPNGFRSFKVSVVTAFAGSLVGYRAVRIYRGRGATAKAQFYINTRWAPADATATTNPYTTTEWLDSVYHDILPGDYFAFYPAQTSGGGRRR